MKRILVILAVIGLLSTSVSALDQLMPFQGNVRLAGVPINAGNLTVSIYDAAAGGNLVYNDTFANAINNGRFDVVLGSQATDLTYNFSQIYYLDFYANGNKITVTRQPLQNGMVTGLFVNSDLSAVQIGVNTSATNNGALAAGYNSGGNINATNQGSFAQGYMGGAGNIYSSAQGSFAQGHSIGGDINATSNGARAMGYVNGSGEIVSSGTGSTATGYAAGGTNRIRAAGNGAFAGGAVNNGFPPVDIYASAMGSFAFGVASGDFAASSINATRLGAIALGTAANGHILSQGQGALAVGRAGDNGFVRALGIGSFAQGYTNGANDITQANGTVAAAHGRNVSVNGDYSFGFGRNVYVNGTAYQAKFFSGTNPGTFYVNDVKVCLENGSNCPAGSGSNETPWTNDTDSVFIKSGYPLAVEIGPGTAYANGSLAVAQIISAGSAAASGNGSAAIGFASLGGTIQATWNGSTAEGYSAGGVIEATNKGSTAGGNTETEEVLGPIRSISNISSSGEGSFAHGDVESQHDAGGGTSESYIIAQGEGSTALGQARSEASGDNTAGIAVIESKGDGSLASGYIVNSGDLIIVTHNISAAGTGSFAQGYSNNGDILATGNGATAKGYAVQSNDIIASNSGSSAGGYAAGAGTNYIQSTHFGSFAYGAAAGAANSKISAEEGGATALGYVEGGTLNSSGYGSFAVGQVTSSGTMEATDWGSIAMGDVEGGGLISATGRGAMAAGRTGGGYINATGWASRAQGYANGTGDIVASGQGSIAEGYSGGAGLIEATNSGSVAEGRVWRGTISSTSTGSRAGGDALAGSSNFKARIDATESGSFSHGYAEAYTVIDDPLLIADARILATNKGATAFGRVRTNSDSAVPGNINGSIHASGEGSFAAGRVDAYSDLNFDIAPAHINSSGSGSVAFGYAYRANITSSGEGSFAAGYTGQKRNIIAEDDASFAFGNPTTGDVNSSGRASWAIGDDVSVPGDFSFAFGRDIQLNGSDFQAAFFGPDAEDSGVFMINRDTYNSSHALVVGTGAGNGNAAYLSKAGTWQSTSSKTKKEDYTEIDRQKLLDDIESTEIYNWKYIGDESNSRHIGPFSEDIYDTFGVGESRKSLSSVDVPGINMAAIQELIKQNKELKERLIEVEQRLAELQ